MPVKSSSSLPSGRRRYDNEFKQEAVRMMLDGQSPAAVAERLGLSSPNVLYTWKKSIVSRAGVAAESLETRVRQLEEELRRVERERDILKKALAIFGRNE